MLDPMDHPSSARAPHLVVVVALVTVLAIVLVSCTHDDGSPTPSTGSSTSDAATTAGAPTLEKSNAKLKVEIAQLRGGVKKSRRAWLSHQIAKPIKGWMDAAYLQGGFPRSGQASYDKTTFTGWTDRAARLALRDRGVTTNSAISEKVVRVVADERSARLFVFAVGGLTGGATARVHLKMTTEQKSGNRKTYVVSGQLLLTRKADRWRIFGYDLHRTVVRR